MDEPSNMTAVWRGLRGLCPNCGKAPLLRRYLKVVSPCPSCGHDNGRYPSDDGPAYFTILIVGHLVVAPLMLSSFIWMAPVWLVIAVTLPAVGALTLLLLPRVKGGVIAVQWAIRRREGVIPGLEDA